VKCDPCSICKATGCPWDLLGDEPVCPDCQERLALGDEDLVVKVPVVDGRCWACDAPGVADYLTAPLGEAAGYLALHLCPAHFRALIGRSLDRASFRAVCRRLSSRGLKPRQVFLLHEAFYDQHGVALMPLGKGEL